MNFDDLSVFVIDSPLIAFMVRLIAEDRKINVIYEIKEGIDNKSKNEYVYDLILDGVDIANKNIISTPSPFFLLNPKKKVRSALKIVSFQLRMNLISRRLKYTKYFGPLTSSLIKSNPLVNYINLDHGVSDYYERISGLKRIKKSTEFILKMSSLFKIHTLIETPSKMGFTLCKLNNDNYIHLDYSKFSLENKISILILEYFSSINLKDATLVFPINKWHSEEGFSIDVGEFDEINLNLVLNNCEKNEFIILKYHPTVYQTGGPSRTLKEKIEKLGYNAIIFDDMLSNVNLKGQIPAEIAIKALNITKLIGENSATFYNVSHRINIKKISCANITDELLNKNSLNVNLITNLNPFLINPILFTNN